MAINPSRGKAPVSVRRKTEHLIHEGKSPEQAYAMAHSMKRAGRLGPRGGYKRTSRKR